MEGNLHETACRQIQIHYLLLSLCIKLTIEHSTTCNFRINNIMTKMNNTQAHYVKWQDFQQKSLNFKSLITSTSVQCTFLVSHVY